jgi:hypothetical protein
VTVVYWIAAVTALLPALHAAVRLVRDRSLTLAAFALAMTSVSASLALAAAFPGVLHAGPAGPAAWVSSGLGVVGTWALAGMLAAENGGVRRFSDLVMMPLMAGASAALFLLGFEVAGRFGAREAAAQSGAEVVGMQLAVLTYYGPGLCRIAALARQRANSLSARAARAGMLSLSASAQAEFGLTLARSAMIVAYISGVRAAGPVVTLIALFQGCAVIQGIAGLAAGPVLAGIASRCWPWLAYWRLQPLSAVMLRAVPQVELPPQRGSRLSIRWRLLRRVIEIRDAELALRAHWREDVADRASAAARSAGLDADLEQAVVEAAVVMDAASACLRGAPPAGDPVPVERICRTAGNDLRSEVARLILVSRVIRRCPVVRELAAKAG